jgi:predicted lipid-binding transport protein (Tim44 family)
MVQEWWRKLNANERFAAQGAIVVFIASLIGGGWISLLGAAAVLVIYWLKYAPNQSITWPAPVPLITLAISGIVGLLALVGLLGLLGFGGVFGAFGGLFGGMYILFLAGTIATVIGAALMVLGTWREYQALPKTTPPAPPAPPSSPPPAAPSTPPAPPAPPAT